MRQSAMLVIEFFESEMQLAIKLIGSGNHKFMNQVVKFIRLDNEVRASKFLSKLIDHFRKILRLGQLGFCKRPHLLQPNL